MKNLGTKILKNKKKKTNHWYHSSAIALYSHQPLAQVIKLTYRWLPLLVKFYDRKTTFSAVVHRVVSLNKGNITANALNSELKKL